MSEEFNVFIAGVGGMGILTATRIIAESALKEGKNVIMSEVHGLSQRYGSVTAVVRIGNVYSPLIKKDFGDLLIGLEPIEALRNINIVKEKEGYIIFNTNQIPPPNVAAGLEQYPNLEDIIGVLRKRTEKLIAINALELAQQIGSHLLQNTILLGIAFTIPEFPLKKDSARLVIKEIFSKKPKVVDMNLKAFDEGIRIGERALKQLS